MSANQNIYLLLLLQLFVLCATRSAGANQFRADYQLLHEAGGWFKLHRVPLDWHTARLQCYHEGGVLASPLHAELWSALKKIVTEAKLTGNVHSGVHATFSDGVYSSMEGNPLEELYMQWIPGEPNNLEGNQKCIVYNSQGMGDSSCEQLLPYVCYRPFSIADDVTECGTVDKEYKLDLRTGHCYKFHARAETWPRALRVCQAEGGHLAVIDSALEADLLRELFAQYPKLLHTPFQNSASVGFCEWGYKNSWWTIHGKLLEQSGYDAWSQGQPDNAHAPGGRAARQACGAIFRTGKLDDVWCDEPLAFICEKVPHTIAGQSQSIVMASLSLSRRSL